MVLYMERVYNFSAGPSMLPLEVLKTAREELLCYGDSGMSVMEMSHRSPEFEEILKGAEDSLRTLMGIPSNYRILFLQGGASTQFASVPLNLLSEHKCADYIISGQFSKKAYMEAKKYGDIAIAASSAGATPTFSTVPEVKRSDFRPDADYVHICFNNTIYGTKFHYIPDTGNIPLVADMSSCILSEPIDVSKFGLIYAGAQKNVAPAGLTIVIVKKSLVDGRKPLDICPTMLKYATQAKADSLYNTPNCFAVYIANLVFRHLLEQGGVAEMEKINCEKAKLLYDYIDDSGFYTNSVEKKYRSRMNVTFVCKNKDLDAAFAKQAAENGIASIKGHRMVGGMRASIYNAMPIEGVKHLISFMQKFAAENKNA